ncbi:MAG: isochorismatase family protein [Solirubrobacterales bacterium]
MKYLLVIDMQEDYVGASRNKKMFPYNAEELIQSINEKIGEYPKDAVIYIVNRYLWEFSNKPKKLVNGLLVVSNNVFEKRKMSCFSNNKLLEFLTMGNASELEIVGVDGNYCVGASAFDGAKKNFEILFNEALVGVGNKSKFEKTKNKLLAAKGIRII